MSFVDNKQQCTIDCTPVLNNIQPVPEAMLDLVIHGYIELLKFNPYNIYNVINVQVTDSYFFTFKF